MSMIHEYNSKQSKTNFIACYIIVLFKHYNVCALVDMIAVNMFTIAAAVADVAIVAVAT